MSRAGSSLFPPLPGDPSRGQEHKSGAGSREPYTPSRRLQRARTGVSRVQPPTPVMQSPPSLALLLLLLLLAAPSHGASLRTELRCQCIKTVSHFIPVKKILRVELTPEGPHCPTVEVIATLKNGMLACLNPEEKWVKKIVQAILNRSSQK